MPSHHTAFSRTSSSHLVHSYHFLKPMFTIWLAVAMINAVQRNNSNLGHTTNCPVILASSKSGNITWRYLLVSEPVQSGTSVMESKNVAHSFPFLLLLQYH
ncbi:hypothetical protein BofuT4_P125960.1 [Botrytis cinerea T4]|uniref:Uncharacterized protein n=1 Tax=Botryotinia fuckeliana (strain T4) TaxID=999810 RepID=G2YSF0_BOTF4|nr:hypothetical protein BofuT4_P125960.1 [Botrytis cinerea T4]